MKYRHKIPMCATVCVAGSLLLGSCTQVEYSNPLDPDGTAYDPTKIEDTREPVITLRGETTYYLTYGQQFAEPGFSAYDNIDGDITDKVEVAEKGIQPFTLDSKGFVTYSVTDNAGNTATRTRIVLVVAAGTDPGDPGTGDPGTGDPGTGDPGTGDPGTGDPGEGDPGEGDPGEGDPGEGDPGEGDPGEVNTAPTIMVSNGGEITILVGQTLPPLATAYDASDGDLTDQMEQTGTVDVNTPGEYQVTLKVTDSGGLSATKTVTVTVQKDNNGPELTLSGQDTMEVYQGVAYNEPGFSAIDAKDGDVTDQVSVTGSVDHTTTGSYEITYSVTDSDGNASTKTRLVLVVPDTQDFIEWNGKEEYKALIDPGDTLKLYVPAESKKTKAGDRARLQMNCDGNITVIVNIGGEETRFDDLHNVNGAEGPVEPNGDILIQIHNRGSEPASVKPHNIGIN